MSRPFPFDPRRAALALGLLALGSGCAARAVRGGEGTTYPDLDRPAMSVTLDRDEALRERLVAEGYKQLERFS